MQSSNVKQFLVPVDEASRIVIWTTSDCSQKRLPFFTDDRTTG